jgi:hypothetical protein
MVKTWAISGLDLHLDLHLVIFECGSRCVTVISSLAYCPGGGFVLVGLILSMAGSGPADISSSWDAFFHDWVRPVVHFGTPALIVLAVLLVLTRVLTGVLVTKDSPGIRSAKTLARLPVSVMYWFGVICLLYSAIEATVVFPFARTVMSGHPVKTAPPAPWTAEFSIGMVAAAGVIVWVLYFVVGRPLRRHVYTPGLAKRKREDLGLDIYARIGWTVPVTVGMALAAGALIVGVIGLWWHYPRLDGRLMPGAYAPLLAVLGVVIVGRARGIGMGLVLQGHDKNGGDDAGLGASVRARLYTLASSGPVGIEVTQHTDVSTLPKEALSLIPDGTLAKLAALFVSLFTPSTPWRTDVTEQSDGSIVVSILRNGVAADAVVIQASTLSLPDAGVGSVSADPGADGAQLAGRNAPGGAGGDQPGGAGGDSPGAPDSAGPGIAADRTLQLRTAAAAFILLTLSERYFHLRAGLSGASKWRSVAIQVIATDPACHLAVDDRRALLVHAVTDDDGNRAAQLALLYCLYRTSADQRENRLFADKLFELLQKVPNEEGMWPLRLRLRFNLLAALLNDAASADRVQDRQPSVTAPEGSDLARVRDVLKGAAEQARHLVTFWQNPGNQKEFPDLWEDMDKAVTFAARAVLVEWKRRFKDKMSAGWTESKDSDVGKKPKMTLLALYEHACTLIGCAAIPGGPPRPDLYAQALDELQMVVAVPEYRIWARSDPSLAELQDIDEIRVAPGGVPGPVQQAGVTPEAAGARAPSDTEVALAAMRAGSPPLDASEIVEQFKLLTGDACPPDFLALSPFAGCRAAIEGRAIHSAAELGQVSAKTLVSELGITAGVAARWLEVAELYMWVRGVPPASDHAEGTAEGDKITTALVFLLMEAELDSVTALQQALGHPPGQFRAKLIECARPWAVAVPGAREIRCWQQEMNADQARTRKHARSDHNDRRRSLPILKGRSSR